MAIDVTVLAAEAAKIGLNPAGYLLRQIVEATLKKVAQANDASPKDLLTLRDDAERQELQMRMAEAHARVAQEVAIARRIETAEEVDIEESYDYSGEGHVGANADGAGMSLGTGGSGRRVSQRVFKFRGNTSVTLPVVP